MDIQSENLNSEKVNGVSEYLKPQNLKLFFGLEALRRRTRLLRLETLLIYLRGSVGGLIYRRRAAGLNFKRRACRGAE